MQYVTLNDLNQERSIHSQFNGYNHAISCGEGQFYDMENMTSDHFPLLAPRGKRGICKTMTNPQGILDKDEMYFVDGDTLYRNNDIVVLKAGVTISTDEDMCPKTLAKMGAIVIIMPDKIWYNTDDNTSGYMEDKFDSVVSGVASSVNIDMCDPTGKIISAQNDDYYANNKAKQGDYCLSKVNGATVLKQWSDSMSMWVNVATTYLQIKCTNIGRKFKAGDGVEIVVDNTKSKWGAVSNLFVNDLGNNKYSTNTVIYDCSADVITIVGIIPSAVSFTVANENELPMTVERKVPDMLFITESNNRLWGCSPDGHEIYASKLGDCKNWNVFQGNSLDSWRATIGTDGIFTGAVTYLGYPMFFKENSVTKIAIGGAGNHQTKDTALRGVERGSERSMTIVNEVLYYKAVGGIVAYDGSLPVGVSDVFGGVRYSNAVGGTINNKYYVCMKDESDNYRLFVYDTKKGMWHIEKSGQIQYFCKNKDELYYIDNETKQLISVGGKLPFDVDEKATEEDFEWYAETGDIGYETNDKKYVTRFNIRLMTAEGTNVDFYIQYDSSGTWEKKFSYSSTGIKTFIVPVIPRRCDHYKWMIKGTGDAKIFSITKITEQGSDL